MKMICNPTIGFVHPFGLACLAIGLLLMPGFSFAQAETDLASSPEIQVRMKLAGDNSSELKKAIADVPEKHQDALKFLILNMPKHDLKTLTSEFLLTNIELAYQARAKANWEIPDEIFFNDVLPYASIDEPRDPWRLEFFQMCQPIVKDCKTASEAAQKLNETVFKQLSVKYSTKRKRANQSPKESIEQGLASCTGLSIILTDACRSVGVPARLAGIPSWKNKRGNHTWVEVWDDKWHFTGAAEPSDQGLNHTWFQNDAALADPDSKLHSIYATSFKQTKTVFPMVWSPEKRVFAENVTARYIPEPSDAAKPKKDVVQAMFRVWNSDKTKREILDVEVFDPQDETQKFTGKSKGGTADMNDMLAFELKPNTVYKIRLTRKPDVDTTSEFKTGEDANQIVEIQFDQKMTTESSTETNTEVKEEDAKGLSAADIQTLGSVANGFFGAGDLDAANQLLRDNPQAARELAWQQYLVSPLGKQRKSDFDKNQVTFEKHLSPYTIKEVGKRPENGWPLFIAMHGGGGAPQKLNDSQWRHMQIYYKDQANVTGYKYLALRAPNNTWNGFYDDYVYPLIENLIQQYVAFGDVDPNKVFIMGYSHGGYGAFAIGPKIPYRFAAVHASAAAPTDGQTTAKTLRNTRFTFMVGERDTAYGRRERCEKFAKQVEELKSNSADDDYPVEFMYKEGFGHGGLPDRDMISQMYDHVRNPAPKHVTWEMTDSVVDRFFWLAVDNPSRGKMIDAKIDGNTIEVKTDKVDSFSIFLDQRLIDPSKPIEIKVDGKSYEVEYKPNFKTLCQSIAKTADVNLSFDFEIKIEVE
ncbi:MAG: transglutaminase domain-containing protein [Mariniblastus sp.]